MLGGGGGPTKRGKCNWSGVQLSNFSVIMLLEGGPGNGEGSTACLIISQPHTTGMKYLSPSDSFVIAGKIISLGETCLHYKRNFAIARFVISVFSYIKNNGKILFLGMTSL